MSAPFIYKNKNRVCSMCGDPLYDDMDYCEGCKDNTTALIPCEKCNGTGEVEVGMKESFASQRTDQRYEKVKCENCEEGWVEE